MLFTYTATVRTVTEDKVVSATNLRSLAIKLGISYFTVLNVIKEKENCLTRKWVKIDRVERETKGPKKIN